MDENNNQPQITPTETPAQPEQDTNVRKIFMPPTDGQGVNAPRPETAQVPPNDTPNAAPAADASPDNASATNQGSTTDNQPQAPAKKEIDIRPVWARKGPVANTPGSTMKSTYIAGGVYLIGGMMVLQGLQGIWSGIFALTQITMNSGAASTNIVATDLRNIIIPLAVAVIIGIAGINLFRLNNHGRIVAQVALAIYIALLAYVLYNNWFIIVMAAVDSQVNIIRFIAEIVPALAPMILSIIAIIYLGKRKVRNFIRDTL